MPLDRDGSSHSYILRNLAILSLTTLLAIAVAVSAIRASQQQPIAADVRSSLPYEETGFGLSEMVTGK